MIRTLALALFTGLLPCAILAETMSWRLATVVSSQQGSETIRRGVALFSNGEPATLTLRLRPTASPSQGRMPFSTHTVYRFEDGSSFVVVGAGSAAVSPEGAPLPVENLIEGSFAEGSGRYLGITGKVTLRSRSGMDRSAHGILGDQFSFAQAEYTISK